MKRQEQSLWWIYALTLLAMLPALVLRDFTPDNELRYLSIADEALREGQVWCFTNHGLWYADKPPLYLWIVMGCRWLFGAHYMLPLALFSAIPMLLIGRIMDRWAVSSGAITDRSQRVLALLMLFTCAYFPGAGLTVRMDMLMTLFIVLALLETWRLTVDGSGSVWMVGLWSFLGLFTKGPLGIIFPLLGSLAFCLWTGRGRKWLHAWSWPAWLVMLGGCVVWWTGVWFEGGQEYLDNLLFHQTVDRAHNAFHHARPWWYYLVAMWYVMAPWSLLMAWFAVRKPREAVSGSFRRMMLAVGGVTLVVLSCISGKLQIYLLPAIPFMVYWLATMLTPGRRYLGIRMTAYVILALIFAFGCALPWLNPMVGYGPVSRQARAMDAPAVVISSEVRRGENIDAYFDRPVPVVSADSLSTLPQGTIILAPGTGGNKLEIVTK